MMYALLTSYLLFLHPIGHYVRLKEQSYAKKSFTLRIISLSAKQIGTILNEL